MRSVGLVPESESCQDGKISWEEMFGSRSAKSALGLGRGRFPEAEVMRMSQMERTAAAS